MDAAVLLGLERLASQPNLLIHKSEIRMAYKYLTSGAPLLGSHNSKPQKNLPCGLVHVVEKMHYSKQ